MMNYNVHNFFVGSLVTLLRSLQGTNAFEKKENKLKREALCFVIIQLTSFLIQKNRDESVVDNMKSPFKTFCITYCLIQMKQSSSLKPTVKYLRCIYFASCLSFSDQPHSRQLIRSTSNTSKKKKKAKILFLFIVHKWSWTISLRTNCLFDILLTLLCLNKGKEFHYIDSLLVVNSSKPPSKLVY